MKVNSFHFIPTQPPGIDDSVIEMVETNYPFTIFSIWLEDEIFNLLVEEINRYTEQCSIHAIFQEMQVQRLGVVG